MTAVNRLGIDLAFHPVLRIVLIPDDWSTLQFRHQES